MLLAAHDVVMSSLDYLVVAQCASLLHQVFIPREDVLQMPWVQGALASKGSLQYMIHRTICHENTFLYLTLLSLSLYREYNYKWM